MMASAQVIKFNCLALIIICMALGAPLLAMATFTCCEVKPVLEACDCYAKTGGDTVPQDCCMAVISLRNEVMNSTLNRQKACHCIQDAARKDPDLNATAYSDIPVRCGVRLPYQFTIDMNCDSVY